MTIQKNILPDDQLEGVAWSLNWRMRSGIDVLCVLKTLIIDPMFYEWFMSFKSIESLIEEKKKCILRIVM